MSLKCSIICHIPCTFFLGALISIYYIFCYPHLTYCVTLGSASGHHFFKKVQISQNKTVRCFPFLGKIDSISGHISSLNIFKFKSIHKYFTPSSYKMLTNNTASDTFVLVYSSHQTGSSNLDLISPPFTTTLHP